MTAKKKHYEDDLDAQAQAILGDETPKVDADLVNIDDLKSQLDDAIKAKEVAETKANENWERLLRSEAQMKNLERQARIDVEKAHKFANEKIFSELLAVLDSFEQGLAAGDSDQVGGLLEGMQLTNKLLMDTLAKFGLTVIDPTGAPFDPQQHEALSMLPTKDVPDNHIFEVVQKGYMLNGRLIRPARVVVAQDQG